MSNSRAVLVMGLAWVLVLNSTETQAGERKPAQNLSTVTFTHQVSTLQSQKTRGPQRFVDVPPASPYKGATKYNDIVLKRGTSAPAAKPVYSKPLTFTLSTTTPAPPSPNLGGWAKASGLDVAWDVVESTKGAGFNELTLDDSSGSSAARYTGRFGWKAQFAPSAVAVESLEIVHEGFQEVERSGDHAITEYVAFAYERIPGPFEANETRFLTGVLWQASPTW